MARRDDLPTRCPVPPRTLDRRRLALRRAAPTSGIGAHRHRRMGQSLSFRDFRDYQRGDDVRTIDWAASSRVDPGLHDLVVRSFEAEERRTLLVLVDCRPTMRLPEGADKLTVAFWVAQALVRMALAERDRAFVGTLFGPSGAKPVPVAGPRGETALVAMAETLRAATLRPEDWRAEGLADTARLEKDLAPSSAVVLVTDALFEDRDGRMARLARAAQRSYRSFHVVELDSWPMERAMLARGPFRLDDVGGRSLGAGPFEADTAYLEQTEAALAAHRASLKRRFQGPGLIWPSRGLRWPDSPEIAPKAFCAWFVSEFLAARVLPSLLSRV